MFGYRLRSDTRLGWAMHRVARRALRLIPEGGYVRSWTDPTDRDRDVTVVVACGDAQQRLAAALRSLIDGDPDESSRQDRHRAVLARWPVLENGDA